MRGFPDSSVGKKSVCNEGGLGLIPELGRFPGEGTGYPLQYSWASLVAQLVKNLPAMWETWVGKIHWSRDRLPTPVFWPGEFQGLHSPWDRSWTQLRDFHSLVAQMVKNLPAMWETQVPSLGQEDPLENRMATHSSMLAWRIP